jgi:hypothetical protein
MSNKKKSGENRRMSNENQVLGRIGTLEYAACLDGYRGGVRAQHVVDRENTNLALMADLRTLDEAEAALSELAAQVDQTRIAIRMGRLRIKEITKWQKQEILDAETRMVLGIGYPKLPSHDRLSQELVGRLLDALCRRYQEAMKQLHSEQRKQINSTRFSLGPMPDNTLLYEVRPDWVDEEEDDER